jgi:hypothetical protein
MPTIGDVNSTSERVDKLEISKWQSGIGGTHS